MEGSATNHQSDVGHSATYAFDDLTAACRTKSFNSEIFPLFHLRLVVVPHEADGFTAMNLIRVD